MSQERKRRNLSFSADGFLVWFISQLMDFLFAIFLISNNNPIPKVWSYSFKIGEVWWIIYLSWCISCLIYISAAQMFQLCTLSSPQFPGEMATEIWPLLWHWSSTALLSISKIFLYISWCISCFIYISADVFLVWYIYQPLLWHWSSSALLSIKKNIFS